MLDYFFFLLLENNYLRAYIRVIILISFLTLHKNLSMLFTLEQRMMCSRTFVREYIKMYVCVCV